MSNSYKKQELNMVLPCLSTESDIKSYSYLLKLTNLACLHLQAILYRRLGQETLVLDILAL